MENGKRFGEAPSTFGENEGSSVFAGHYEFGLRTAVETINCTEPCECRFVVVALTKLDFSLTISFPLCSSVVELLRFRIAAVELWFVVGRTPILTTLQNVSFKYVVCYLSHQQAEDSSHGSRKRMSVIIRLQNLPWNAHALDIRQFFKGMSIPDGGVHIVGGDLGDAFIAFTTDEDARKAMMLTGEKLNGVSVKLMLSSKAEMQKVIAAARGGLQVDTDDRPDGRPSLPMAHITVSPAFGPGPVGGGVGGPYVHRPPPFGAPHSRPPPGSMEGAAGALLGQVGFHQGNDGSLPFHSGIPPARSAMQNFPMRETSSKFPIATPNSGPIVHNLPSQFGTQSRMPQSLGVVKDQGADGPGSGRSHRAEIVRYDRPRSDNVARESGREPDEKLRRSSSRDEKRHDRPRLTDKNAGVEQRGTSREDGRRREQHRDSRKRSFEEDRKSDRDKAEGRAHDRPEDGRAAGDERRKHDDDWHRQEDRERRSERDRKQDDSLDRRNSRKRERERDRSPDGRRDRYREGVDSREREKHGRYSQEDERRRAERPRDMPQPRARHGTEQTNGDQFNDRQDPGTCAFISHLPTVISYKDVRRFFFTENLRLPDSGLKLENDEFGHRNGNAYVMFMTKEQRDKALSFDGALLQDNRIRIEKCSLAGFERAVDSFVPQDHRRKGIERTEQRVHETPPNVVPRESQPLARDRKHFFETCCVMMRNLPARVERHDIRLYFRNLNITNNGVYIPFDNKGLCLGVAYVEFEKVSEAEEALRRYDGTEYMNSKHIVDMYPITMDEAKERIEQHKKDFMRGGSAARGPSEKRNDWREDDRRNMHRREDRSFEDRDRRERFDTHRDLLGGGRDEKIHHQKDIVHRLDQRDRDRFDQRDRARFGQRMNEHDQRARLPPGDVGVAPQGMMHPRFAEPSPPREVTGGSFQGATPTLVTNQKFQCVKLMGMPFTTEVGLVEAFFFDLSVRPNGIHVVFFPDARCIGEAYVEFTSVDDCTKALQRSGAPLGQRPVSVSSISESDMVSELNNHKSNGRYIVSRVTPEAPGQPCDVIMSGVPFKATMLDVSQFLQGTSYVPESILFEVDQQGNAMGNVKVTFINSQAAHKALLTLIRKEFFGRFINFKVL